jgi:hypothetical protein
VGVRREGAKAAVERVFVAGTRRDDAAEGGGRRGVLFEGRGGGGIELNVGGFSAKGVWVGAADGTGTGFVCKLDEDHGELVVAGCGILPAGDASPSACASSIFISGDSSQRDCSCFKSAEGEASLANFGC